MSSFVSLLKTTKQYVSRIHSLVFSTFWASVCASQISSLLGRFREMRDALQLTSSFLLHVVNRNWPTLHRDWTHSPLTNSTQLLYRAGQCKYTKHPSFICIFHHRDVLCWYLTKAWFILIHMPVIFRQSRTTINKSQKHHFFAYTVAASLFFNTIK